MGPEEKVLSTDDDASMTEDKNPKLEPENSDSSQREDEVGHVGTNSPDQRLDESGRSLESDEQATGVVAFEEEDEERSTIKSDSEPDESESEDEEDNVPLVPRTGSV